MSCCYQKIIVRFYVDSVEDLDYWQCTNVSDVDHIPPGLAMFPRAVKYSKRNELCTFNQPNTRLSSIGTSVSVASQNGRSDKKSGRFDPGAAMMFS